MLNTVYRLTAPRTIEPVVVSQDTTDKVIVRPTHLSICNADQRYYQGTRSKEVLAKKLPWRSSTKASAVWSAIT